MHLAVNFRLKVPVERSTFDKFHDQKYLFVGVKGFVKLGYMFMVQFFHNLYLSFNTFPSVWF